MNQVTTKNINDIDSCLERMKQEGFVKKFVIKEEGVHDEETGNYYASDKITIVNFFFFNSSIVYGIETNDKVRGTIISTKIIQ
jgi:hypothetical protein